MRCWLPTAREPSPVQRASVRSGRATVTRIIIHHLLELITAWTPLIVIYLSPLPHHSIISTTTS